MDYRLSNKKDLIELLDATLIPLGYVRVKDNWYFTQQDIIHVIALGKSNYGGQFSLALALLLSDLAPDLTPYPEYHLCHFRGLDLRFLLPEGEVLREALNLENHVPAASRAITITNAITEFAVPFLSNLKSKRAVAQQIKLDAKLGFDSYCDLELKLHLKAEQYLSWEDLKLEL